MYFEINSLQTLYIILILKKGDNSKASHYRPASLTSITCKLIKHIIYSSINVFHKYTIIIGFRPGFQKHLSLHSSDNSKQPNDRPRELPT